MSGTLITGGSQPLARRLGQALRHRGPVLLVGIDAPGELRLPDGVTYQRVDLTFERQVRALIAGPVRELGLDAVVHLAYRQDPHLGRDAYGLNVDATRTLLAAAEASPGLNRFVYRSSAEVYLQRGDEPDVIREDRPLNHESGCPPWICHRVEADAWVSARSGLADRLRISVLRCAEIFAEGVGSQLHDYLSSRLCLRRMGFDPMLELLSLDDAVRAFALAVEQAPVGAFNIPGADTLPLSRAIRLWGRNGLPVPALLLGPLYGLRHLLAGAPFQYRANRARFHYNGVLDGSRARQHLGYLPEHPIGWPGRVTPPPNGGVGSSLTGGPGATMATFRRLMPIAMLLFVLPVPTAQAVEWKEIYTQDGVAVSKASVEGTRLVAFKGDTVMNAPVSKVLAVLLDDTHRVDWVDRLYLTKVLSQSSDFDYVVYQAFELPAIFSNRDYVYRAVTTRDPSTGVVTQSLESVDYPGSPETVGVRAELVNSRYLLTPTADNQTRVEVEILTDPKGKMPSWLVNLIQRSWPLDTLSGIREQLGMDWVHAHALPGAG